MSDKNESMPNQDSYSVPEGEIPSPMPPEPEQMDQDQNNFIASNVMFGAALLSFVLFATPIGIIAPLAIIPVSYLMCRNVFKAKPGIFPMIVAGAVFGFTVVYAIGMAVSRIN